MRLGHFHQRASTFLILAGLFFFSTSTPAQAMSAICSIDLSWTDPLTGSQMSQTRTTTRSGINEGEDGNNAIYAQSGTDVTATFTVTWTLEEDDDPSIKLYESRTGVEEGNVVSTSRNGSYTHTVTWNRSDNDKRTLGAYNNCNEGCFFGSDQDLCAMTVRFTNNREQIEEFRLTGSYDYCKQVPTAQRDACLACVGNTTGSGDVPTNLYTAVGCIRTDSDGLVADIVRLLLGVGGGVALLSILAASFMLSTSQGESGKVKKAKELATASVAGIVFMIFSTMVLQFIGVTILRIPGL